MPEIVGRLRPPRLATAPASPAGGEIYYDTALTTLRSWNGTTWVNAGASGSGLPADTVIVAGTRIISNKLLSGDAQPAWRVLGSGQQEWGVGGSTALDIKLYRDNLPTPGLSTDSPIRVYDRVNIGQATIAADSKWPYIVLAQNGPADSTIGAGIAFRLNAPSKSAWDIYTQGDTNGVLFWGQLNSIDEARLGTDAFALRNQKITWGANPRTQVGDTNLYRFAANDLRTDGVFTARAGSAGLISIGNDPNTPVIYFGNQFDTVLYRSSAKNLRMNGSFTADEQIVCSGGPNANGFIYNPATMRGAAAFGSLKQGDSSWTFYITDNGTLVWGPGGTGATDINFYRRQAGQLGTDNSFYIGTDLTVNGAISFNGELFRSNAKFFVDTGGTIVWGPGDWSRDTYLYRYAANQLETPGIFRAKIGFVSTRSDGGVAYNFNPPSVTGYGFASTVGSDVNARFYFDVNGKLGWGSGGSYAADVFLERGAAGQLNLTGVLFSTQRVFSGSAGTGGIWVDGGGLGGGSAQFVGSMDQVTVGIYNGAAGWGFMFDNAGKFWLGGQRDTNLYRSAADTLKTDDNFIVAGNLTVQGTISGGGTGGFNPGNVILHAGGSAPSGWLICDGSAVSRTTYAALFAAIGTLHGAGDGSTTFNLPNIKSRVPVGLDSSDGNLNAIGKTGGEKTHQLTIAELAAHNHGVNDGWHAHGLSVNGDVMAGNVIGGNTGIVTEAGSNAAHATINSAPTGISIQNQGSSTPHNIMQPYVVMYYIIKT